MADKEVEATTPQGADWEVVSLTASAYAASPGGNTSVFKPVEKGDIVDKHKVETSDALFMSRHFLSSPRQHETTPSDTEKTEMLDQHDDSESVKDLGGKPNAKEEENWDLKKFTELDCTEDANLSGLNLAGKAEIIYSSPMLHSLHSEASISPLIIDDEMRVVDESLQSSEQAKEDNHDASGVTYTAWWKNHAISLYAHAKETNTFWSIFAAAAVMGVVIIVRQWQQESWIVLSQDWKSRIHDERMRMMAGPISRFKDVIVSGNHRDCSIASRERP